MIRSTPLIFAPPLNCWLKLESLQTTGSFKLRGAARKLERLSANERARGVVTASAGNHGLGVARAAAHFGVAATVVVPRAAPAVKREGIARLGAQVLVEGEDYGAAEARAMALGRERGLVFVSAFDDEDVIDGNGRTLGDELRAQHAGLTRVIAPVGGGGLVAGLLRAFAGSGVEVVGVQPAANCAMHESLALGRALTRYDGGATLCEGLEGAVAERTFAAAQAQRLRIALVDEDEVLAAIGFAYCALGLIVEASAAVTLAAARVQRLPTDEETVLVVTGGNIDAELLDRAITRFLANPRRE
jgi:threonine dehydratase